jgi:hypothetical protein
MYVGDIVQPLAPASHPLRELCPLRLRHSQTKFRHRPSKNDEGLRTVVAVRRWPSAWWNMHVDKVKASRRVLPVNSMA